MKQHDTYAHHDAIDFIQAWVQVDMDSANQFRGSTDTP